MGLEALGRLWFTTPSVQSYKVRALSSSAFLLWESLLFSSVVVGLHIPCSRSQLMDWMNAQVAVFKRTVNKPILFVLPRPSSGMRLGLNIAMLLKLWTVLFVIFAATPSHLEALPLYLVAIFFKHCLSFREDPTRTL